MKLSPHTRFGFGKDVKIADKMKQYVTNGYKNMSFGYEFTAYRDDACFTQRAHSTSSRANQMNYEHYDALSSSLAMEAQ